MKNTPLPLDLIFIDANKTVINIHKNAQPFDIASIASNGEAQYVLEIKGGESEHLNILLGMKIEYTTYE